MSKVELKRIFKNDNLHGYILEINDRVIPLSFEEGEALLKEAKL